MGCYSSKTADSPANRVARWRSTGIVALRDRKLKEVPSEIFEVDRFVRTLDLTNNNIVEIPSEITRLISMQRLVLAENLIERLPANLGVFKSLKVLKLDVGSLSRLEKLSIAGNSLLSLPKTIGDLHNLLLLNVSNNKLKTFPESIGSCTSLEELQADGNLVEELPSSICSLINLKSLSLNSNNIKKLPQNLLKDCKALQNISLHENPISMDQFQQMEGFQSFEARRKKKFDKQIDSNVMMSSSGLDEGLDLKNSR
ncbi:L domain-like protein [Dioscorea alata]|uniref:L domain-like protein n=1 Tax=Dioscorea alata TaxID=55571 RepID=A0ACB7TWI5_DIOAL|nr:L domain-like protein [Dioscorea alata]